METNPNVVKRDGDVEAATILPELKVIGGWYFIKLVLVL